MQENKNKYYDIAERIYDLDGEVYECVGSSLGRTFTGDKRTCVNNLVMLMRTKPQGHLLRSELALISNMARTIRKDEDRSRLMKKYDEILKEIAELPASFGKVEILDENRAKLNTANLRQKFSKDDHLIICIGRTQGSAGNDIGFALADALRINYYDAEIFNEVLRRLDAEKDSVTDVADLGTDLLDLFLRVSRIVKDMCQTIFSTLFFFIPVIGILRICTCARCRVISLCHRRKIMVLILFQTLFYQFFIVNVQLLDDFCHLVHAFPQRSRIVFTSLRT